MPPFVGWVAVAGLASFLGIYPMLSTVLAWKIGRNNLRIFVLLFVAGWIATEWLRATLFTGYAWNPLGIVWLPRLSVAQIASLIGTYGLSGFTVLLAGAFLWLAKKDWLPGGVVVGGFFLALVSAPQSRPRVVPQ